MKWIVAAILVCIVPYTFVTLHYRKPQPAFEPYADMKSRANVTRLLSAGFQRVSLTAHPAAEPARIAAPLATVAAAPGGLPGDLNSTLVEPPLLPLAVGLVSAPATANALQPYAIQFTCALPDDKQQLSGAEMYVRNGEAVIAPTFEPVGGELLTRNREPLVLLTIPAGALKPGNYQILLVGERRSQTWPLEVR